MVFKMWSGSECDGEILVAGSINYRLLTGPGAVRSDPESDRVPVCYKSWSDPV